MTVGEVFGIGLASAGTVLNLGVLLWQAGAKAQHIRDDIAGVNSRLDRLNGTVADIQRDGCHYNATRKGKGPC